jgi:hypothetical protein
MDNSFVPLGRIGNGKRTLRAGMIFEMRFQILALAASLAVSTLAGYVLAIPPSATPAKPDRFAAIGDVSQWPATIFTEFGNEMAWEIAWEETAERCVAPPREVAHGGNGLLDRLVHRVSEDSRDRQTEMAGKSTSSCPAR